MEQPFIKTAAGEPEDFFFAEAAGLRWLAAAGAGSAAVVPVLEVDANHIVLARLTPARPTRAAAADFGRAPILQLAPGRALSDAVELPRS